MQHVSDRDPNVDYVFVCRRLCEVLTSLARVGPTGAATSHPAHLYLRPQHYSHTMRFRQPTFLIVFLDV